MRKTAKKLKHKIINSKQIRKRLASIVIFVMLALFLAYEEPTIEIAWVTAILLLTIYLFAFEVVDIDVAAISIMVLLGLTTLLAPIMGLEKGLVDPNHLFDGFSSNAVMSIIAVMIIGAGLDKTGIMGKVANFILNIGGKSEGRIIPIISGTVAIISSFMQNVGAAALFLPVVARISVRSGVPISRLLMPMGFCAILGGTVTMVGSSPLILLNDLIHTSNTALAADQQMETWSLFSTTPVGLMLVAVGILYFLLMGRFVLPVCKTDEKASSKNKNMQRFQDVYGLDYALHEVVIGEKSKLIGKRLDDIETKYKIRVIATKRLGKPPAIGPGALNRDTGLEANMVMVIISESEDLSAFLDQFEHLLKRDAIETFAEDLSLSKSGIAEIVIPPGSNIIGKSARDVWMRKTYGTAMIGLHRDGETLHKGDDIRSLPLQSGDTLVVHTPWEALRRIEQSPDFVVITKDYPQEDFRPQKLLFAGVFFVIALFMVLFTDIRLSIALLTGAIGMILSGVLSIDEAYHAVSWKTVFLLASLIPLGLAVEQTGTAKWIADQTLSVVGDMPIWVIQTAVAILATFFTLVMSNVGATVLLVPLAVNIALGVGADPAVFALTVALATSNSFLIPTHQVNALIMGPGGYRVPDFLKAGGLMTILFLAVMIFMMNLIY
ncbi:MAG TPA: SLC13 family permease [Leucothrix sp.]|nr:SLC13 family permease [Leucothrix sp.]